MLHHWHRDVPVIYHEIVSVVIRARLRLGDEENSCLSPTSLVATNQGHLLLVAKGNLINSTRLPFSDCSNLIVYRSHHLPFAKEFVAAVSADQAALVDLRTFLVVKEWTDVEEVGVEDRLMTGAPQLVLRLRGCTEPLVVDEENGWNAVGVGSVEPEETPLHSVVRALQAQLQNSLQNLHEVQRCTSLRSAALNRSLAVLGEISAGTTTHCGPPSFLIPVTPAAEGAPPACLPPEAVRLTAGAAWQCVVDAVWVLGVIFTNNYGAPLTAVECLLAASTNRCSKPAGVSRRTDYSVDYYLLDATDDAADVADFVALAPDSSRRVAAGQSLAVVVRTELPPFDGGDEESAELLLTCRVADGAEERPLQTNLGRLTLTFDQFQSRVFHVDMNRLGSGGVAAIRRHLISVSAVLDARQEVLVVSAGGHPAADCLERFIRRMELTPLQPLALYAGRTTFGRVVLWLRPEVHGRLRLTIRAESSSRLGWIVRSLQKSLPDGVALLFEPPKAPQAERVEDDAARLGKRIASVLTLLAGCRRDADCAMETAPLQSASASLEQIRSRFVQRQYELVEPESAGGPEIFHIPAAQFKRWQTQDCGL